MLECSVCGIIYKDSASHYFHDCGKNLTLYIEATDVILIFSKSFKVIGLIEAVIFTYPLAFCGINPFCIDGSCIGGNYTILDWLIVFASVYFIILGCYLKRIFYNMCLKNIRR